MKSLSLIIIIVMMIGCKSQEDRTELRSILLEKLKKSYDDQNWFVPLKNATQGLNADQANWKDSTGNHSIGELVSHLIFWNERNLIAFQGNTLPNFSGNNEETFQKFTNTNWERAIARLDSVHTLLTYHTGQIIYIRKLKGWWDSQKGVK
jgi:hypothetical protein